MSDTVYRLVKPGVFRADTDTLAPRSGEAVVRPTYLSICAADQRYWSGRRDPAALREKLPMALIHEAVGVVEEDQTGTFAPGTAVVMVPNVPDPHDPDTLSKENYARGSRFRSSSMDGFMATRVAIPAERLVPCEGVDPLVAVMAELVSVSLNAVDAFGAVRRIPRCEQIGIWGDGTVGYLIACVLRELYPQLQLLVFGTHDDKLAKFGFVDATHNIRREFREAFPQVDHAFECVGGVGGSESALEQIIGCIRPQGVISLMGVAELPVPLNTRMVLEKGLTLQGNSRSSKEDFERAVELFARPAFAERVGRVVRQVVRVHSMNDMQLAFEFDEKNSFKTVMKWELMTTGGVSKGS